MKDQFYRKRIREMLLNFYKDVATAGFFDKEKTMSLKEFNDFVDEWIEKHFPLEIREEE